MGTPFIQFGDESPRSIMLTIVLVRAQTNCFSWLITNEKRGVLQRQGRVVYAYVCESLF